MLKNNQMKAFVLCLCMAMIVAWPSGIYILDGYTSNQFYNPLTQPHSQLDVGVVFRGDHYKVAQKLVAKTNCASLIVLNE